METAKNGYRIAVLGFGSSPGPPCSASWKTISKLAYGVGMELVKGRATVVCGGTTGIFKQAFLGAHAHFGQTIAILERGTILDQKILDEILKAHDHVYFESTGPKKHATIVDLCHAALGIGGGISTLTLMTEFLAEGKPVACLEQSGGVAEAVAFKGLLNSFGVKVIRGRDPKLIVRKLLEAIEVSRKLKEKVA